MKKFFLFTIALWANTLIHSQVKLNEWNDTYYQNYNSQNFKNLSIVNKEIDPNNIDYRLLNAAIFYRTNEERVAHGREEYMHSSKLEKAAFGHSKDMVDYNFYSHTSPLSGKSSMSDRIKAVGITYSSCAENIFNFFLQNPSYWELADGLVKGWMNSDGHKKNILNPSYNYLGCGAYHYVNAEWQDYFWVKSTQNFSN
jgi:uncharacterized protein YkwD